ncbi:biotin--[acetyl-CoA-carboxylase] ligase [Undibacterium sp. RuRC25W]|uniref:biotin--[acetyl-CoA-carboxylase] ligase n=1 Tax=Undibacterium sp. RuRC25W TaxID=3413047 RepID=UPI003BF433D8
MSDSPSQSHPPSDAAPSSELNASQIAALRDAFGMLLDVEVVQETGSTNTDLMTRLDTLDKPVLRLAVHQMAGRGRAGRSWSSEAGSMLMFSIAWPMPHAAHELMGLPLAVGVALAEVLHALDLPVQLKWPNDILRDGKKLAGILIESASKKNGGTWIVAGIGLNLLLSASFEASLGRAVAEAPWLARMNRNALVAQLLNALARAFDQFEREGFSAFQVRWNQLHAYANQEVRIIDHGEILQAGTALGVDISGRLVLQTAQGQVNIVAGDVSLRPVDSSE